MSYVSALKNIPSFLGQPTGIAAIASVGIHGAIAFILPLVPVDSKPKATEAPKSVALVELDSEEQSRLPNTIGNAPQIARLPQNNLQTPLPLPGFAIEPTPLPPTGLPSVPPPPASTPMILPPLPKSSSPSVASLPKTQPVRIVPQKSYEMNPSFKAPTARQSYPNYSFNSKNVEIGSVPRTGGATNKPVASSQPALNKPVASSAPSSLPNLQAGAIPNDLPKFGPPIPYTSRSVPIQGNPSSGITLPNNQIINNGQTQDFFAPGTQPSANNQIALARDKTPQWRRPQNGTSKSPKIAASPTKVSVKTSFGEQLREVDQKFPNSETQLLISDTVKTKSVPEGKVEGVLVVNPKGQVDYFAISDRSIPSEQKIAARKYFQNYFQKNPPQADGKVKKYPFRLAFSSGGSNAALNDLKVDANRDIADRLRDAKQTQSSQQAANSTPIKIKPSPQQQVIIKQPAPATANPDKPSLSKPSPQQQVIIKQPAPATANPDKPSLSERLTNDNKQSAVAKPQGTAKAKPTPQIIINPKQPAPTPQATSKPSLTTRLINSQSESESPETSKPFSSDKSEKLIQKLRKLKQERQGSQ